MANGDLCIHCRYQETVHDHPEYGDPDDPPCASFTSPYCDDPLPEAPRGPIRHEIWLLTPYGVVDIGS